MEKMITKEGVEPRDYEVALLVPSEEVLPGVLKILGTHNIEIKSEGSIKKIRLAYDIAKMKEAYFAFFHVSAFPSGIKLLEADLRGNSNILRFLVVRLPGTKAERDEATMKRAGNRPSFRRSPAAPPQQSDARQPNVLSNEALEKKIEEI